MKNRFLIIPLLTILLLIPLKVRGDTQNKDEKKYGGTLILSSITKPVTLNPIVARDSVSTHLVALVFNSLIMLNSKGEPVGDLAKKWSVSKDGLTWTFNLKRGVKFQDGVEMTSEDVLFTYQELQKERRQSPFSPLLNLVGYFDAPDRYTFRVYLKKPYSPIIYLMAQCIVPKHIFCNKPPYDPLLAKKPIGTGPFIISDWEKDRIIFKANKNYFRDRPYLDRVIVKFFPTRLSAWIALLKGEVDVVTDLNYDDYRVIQNDRRFRVYSYLDIFYYTLLFNMEDPIYSNTTLRRAISLAIDRKDLIDTVLNGMGVETTGPFLPGSWAYNDNVKYQSYNPAYAKKLLAQSGYGKKTKLTLNILINRGDTIKERLVKRLKWQLFKIGIRVNIRVVDTKKLFRVMLFPGKFQSVLLQFNTGVYPDKNIYLFWDSKNIGRFNIARYKNRKVDKLIEEAWGARTQKEKEKIYKEIHSLIAKDVPAAFLFYRRKYLTVSSRIGGVAVKPEVLYHSISDWYVRK